MRRGTKSVKSSICYGAEETLIVVSSDLSHYYPYADARRFDRATGNAILALSATLDHEQACGATPINGLLLAAQRRRLRPELLDLRNSGDTAGDKARVVGYSSFALYEGAEPTEAQAGSALIEIAKDRPSANCSLSEGRRVAPRVHQ
jgi:AmmeMemoRadiSam system protein B